MDSGISTFDKLSILNRTCVKILQGRGASDLSEKST